MKHTMVSYRRFLVIIREILRLILFILKILKELQ